MDQIDKIENDLRLIRISLLGDDNMNLKGMKQQMAEFMIDTTNRISDISEEVSITKNRVTKIETRNRRFGWFGKGAIAGGGIMAGVAGKAFWIKIISFLGGLFSGIVSLTYIYSII